MHEFIEDVVDVQADGHCGYQVIAACFGEGEDSWPLIRLNLIKEMKEWRDLYTSLFGSEERYEILKQSLYVQHAGIIICIDWI